MSVVQLTDGVGLSASLRTTINKLQKELWEAIDRAIEAGIPQVVLIGQVECLKLHIAETFMSEEEE